MFRKFRLTSLALAFACSAFATASTAQEPVSLTAAQWRELGSNLLASQKPAEALSVAQALIARNPEDVYALLLASQSAEALRNPQAWLDYARKAYWASNSSTDSFYAARFAANALIIQGKDTRAQLWLRRARQYAPNDLSNDAIARDYQALRQRNPLSVSLSFGAVPTSNINGGSDKTVGVGFVSPPLSGLQYSGAGQAKYRLAASSRSATFLNGSLDFNLYSFSKEAKEIAGTQTADDFSKANLSFGISHRRLIGESSQPTDFSLLYSRKWAGGDLDYETLTFGVSHSWTVSEKDNLGLSISAKHKNDFELEDARSVSAALSWNHKFGDDTLRISASREVSRSENVNDGFNSVGLAASYDFGTAIEGFTFGVSASISESRFDVAPPLSTEDRVDWSRGVSLTVANENIEFYGFLPTLKVSRTYVDSTFPLFDRGITNIGFDFRSSF